MFEDLIVGKDRSPLSSLQPCDMATRERIRRDHPHVPQDYLEFLGSIGAGLIGDGRYSLYTGLTTPRSVFGVMPPGTENILLFGDDMQGFCAGFDVTTWQVVEIDSSDMSVRRVAPSFEAFLRRRLASVRDTPR